MQLKIRLKRLFVRRGLVPMRMTVVAMTVMTTTAPGPEGATGKAKARPKIRQGAGGGRGAETKQVTTSQMCVQLAAGDSVTHGTAA